MRFAITVEERVIVTYYFDGENAEEAALAIVEGDAGIMTGDSQDQIWDGMIENTPITVHDSEGHEEIFEWGNGWVRPQ